MSWEALDPYILWPALVAGLLVTATHVPLGMQVLARGIVFIDIAIAQIAGCGVLLATCWASRPRASRHRWPPSPPRLEGRSCSRDGRAWPEVQEAVICVVFVLAATGGVLLLASNVHGSEHLRDLLVGQILWVKPSQLALPPSFMRPSSASGSGGERGWGARGLRDLALAVTVSVQWSVSTSCSPP